MHTAPSLQPGRVQRGKRRLRCTTARHRRPITGWESARRTLTRQRVNWTRTSSPSIWSVNSRPCPSRTHLIRRTTRRQARQGSISGEPVRLSATVRCAVRTRTTGSRSRVPRAVTTASNSPAWRARRGWRCSARTTGRTPAPTSWSATRRRPCRSARRRGGPTTCAWRRPTRRTRWTAPTR